MDYVVKKKKATWKETIYILMYQAASIQGGQSFSFEKTRLTVLIVGLLSMSLNTVH